jgi:cytochrome c oxidase subunit 2
VTVFDKLLKEAADTAPQVDTAFFFLLLISGAIFLVLLVLVVAFSAHYRRGSKARRGALPAFLKKEIEIGWTSGTIFLALFIFWWFVGGLGFPDRQTPGQLEIHIVAKQWMWKAQHPSGAREIDALHLPVNMPIRLIMTSEDVIHSFYVPAFRLKQDVLPGRDTYLTFTPTEIGRFHLFCAEYCGTQHSHMTGEVVVLTASDYAAWSRDQPSSDNPVSEGNALYGKLGCAVCHARESRVHAPKLDGLYGTMVKLTDGRSVRADDAYLSESITHPRADIVDGYAPLMPSYADIAKADDISALIAYIKSLSPAGDQK